jgi:hypothetical protein
VRTGRASGASIQRAASIGLALAFPLARVLGSLLWGIAPSDPPTYAGIGALLLGVAALASGLPARRAAPPGSIR